MVELKGRSSDILRNLFDDTSEYTKEEGGLLKEPRGRIWML